jgi:hypothetical protein
MVQVLQVVKNVNQLFALNHHVNMADYVFLWVTIYNVSALPDSLDVAVKLILMNAPLSHAIMVVLAQIFLKDIVVNAQLDTLV